MRNSLLAQSVEYLDTHTGGPKIEPPNLRLVYPIWGWVCSWDTIITVRTTDNSVVRGSQLWGGAGLWSSVSTQKASTTTVCTCPGQKNRGRPVPVPMTGVRYNSLF